MSDWRDRTRERFRDGSITGVALIVLALLAVLIALFLLRNTWPG